MRLCATTVWETTSDKATTIRHLKLAISDGSNECELRQQSKMMKDGQLMMHHQQNESAVEDRRTEVHLFGEPVRRSKGPTLPKRRRVSGRTMWSKLKPEPQPGQPVKTWFAQKHRSHGWTAGFYFGLDYYLSFYQLLFTHESITHPINAYPSPSFCFINHYYSMVVVVFVRYLRGFPCLTPSSLQ